MKKLLSLFLVLFCGLIVQAGIAPSVTIDNIKYVLYPETKTATVNFPQSIVEANILGTIEYEGETYTTTSLSERFTTGCYNLKKVTVPGTIKKIDDFAFDGCSAETIIVCEGVEELGVASFGNCSNLKTISLPTTLKVIGAAAFNDCTKLETEMTVPSTMTEIGEKTFKNCTKLPSIKWSEAVTSIGNSAFEGCKSLTVVGPTAGIKSIGDKAFKDCQALEYFEMTNNLEHIGQHAFYDCESLKSPLHIPDGMTYVPAGVFYHCRLAPSVSIPSTVTIIGFNAFTCCGFEEIDLPDEISSIGGSAFAGCSNLKKINLGNSLTVIGDRAFDGCSGLTDIVLPSTLSKINEDAFADCTGLKYVICMSTTPPKCTLSPFGLLPYYYDIYHIWLVVPDGCKNVYVKDTWFGDFERVNISGECHYVNRIIEMSDYIAGVDDIEVGVAEPQEVYNLNGVIVGNSVGELPSGVYIVRRGSKVKKVMVQ